jgi:hypothetical protein
MRKNGEKKLLWFLEKKKGEELTKGGIGTRHPLPLGGTMTRGAGTSSSSGGTVTGGPVGLLPLARLRQRGPTTGPRQGGWDFRFLQ